MSRLGDRLAELREDRALTQTALAEYLHLSNSTISAYETGLRAPNVDTLIELARFFDVTADYLLGLTSSSVSLGALAEPMHGDVTFADALRMLECLNPEQRMAVSVVLKEMTFSADIAHTTKLHGKKIK